MEATDKNSLSFAASLHDLKVGSVNILEITTILFFLKASPTGPFPFFVLSIQEIAIFSK